MKPVNLKAKFASFDETWVPKVAGALNGQLVKLCKLDGEFVWHSHEHEDELFLVVEGELELHLRDGVVTLREGEFYIVPRGVEHKPVTRQLACVLVFEPESTRNTGEVDNDITLEPSELERI